MLFCASNLSKRYCMGAVTVHALREVCVTVRSGEFVVLRGASGSGKSTLLNLIAGLDRHTTGTLKFLDLDLQELSDVQLSVHRRTNIGIVFQSFNLIPSLTALDNVCLAMVFAGVPSATRRRRGGELLQAVGLTDRAGHRPGELSGGEQQRVAIARALANDPTLLLADEPTGNLDSSATHQIMHLLKTLNEERGNTVVMVTHNADLSERYATRTITLHDGRVVTDTGSS